MRLSTAHIAFFATLSFLILSLGCARRDSSRPLVVVSYGGGAWQDSHKKAFIEPFQRETGHAVVSEAWNAEYGKLKNQVLSGDVPWDVVEVTAAQYVRGKRDGIFSPLHLDVDPSAFVPGAIDSFGIANVYWSTVMAYSPTAFQGRTPTTWRDFWDTRAFPGARAMYNDPRGNLEIALLADGVPDSALYPLDIDRAFRSLDKIKSSIRVWWEDGTQPISLLTQHQVTLTTAWNGRLFAARRDGTTIPWSWNGAVHDLDWWVVPRGARNATLAARFISFASQAEAMSRQAELVGYGPANMRAIALLPDTVASMLPTSPAHFGKGVTVDSRWWADHEAEVQHRWISWKAK